MHDMLSRQKQKVDFLRVWEWGFTALTISKQWCSFQVQVQTVLEKVKENSELIAHGNGTECLQTTTSTEIKPQLLNKAKQGKQKS